VALQALTEPTSNENVDKNTKNHFATFDFIITVLLLIFTPKAHLLYQRIAGCQPLFPLNLARQYQL